MNSKTKEFFRRLLSLRNVVPVLIIVGAFIGTFVATPFGLQRDQLLLALLAFLAVDALIERLELLANIEKDVGALRELVTSQSGGKDFLKHRRDFGRLEQLIAAGKKEIWVSGITLDTMATLTGTFNSKLQEGLKLRFLAICTDESIVGETSDYLGIDPSDLVARLNANMGTLRKRLVSEHPQQVEIRSIDHRPALGYFIVDPHLDQAYITAQSYLYRIQGADGNPMIVLSKKTDAYWFNIYLKDFERLWNSATQ